MTANRNPPRLRESAELTETFRGVDDSEQVLSPASFEAVRMAVRKQIATPQAGTAGLVSGGKAGMLIAVLAGLIVVSGVGMRFLGDPRVTPTKTSPAGDPPATEVIPDAPVVTATPQPGAASAASAPNTNRSPEDGATSPRVRRDRRADQRTRAGNDTVHDVDRANPIVTESPAEPPLVEPDSSSLAEQIRLYEQASRLAQAAKCLEAIEQLETLLRRFPSTPLRPEIALARIEYLIAARQHRAAISRINGFLRDGGDPGKQAELARVLGDLYVHIGDCANAVRAYQKALAGSLAKAEQDAAARGIDGCRSTSFEGPPAHRQ